MFWPRAQRLDRQVKRCVNAVAKDGAQERTRTSTPLRALAPEASASTNSATWALGAAPEVGEFALSVNAS